MSQPIFLILNQTLRGLVLLPLLGLGLLVSAGAWSNCSAVFPGGAQNHSPDGRIRLKPRVTVTGSGTQLSSNNVSAPGGFNSCVTATCSANNSPTTALSVAIQATSGGNGSISLNSGATGSYASGNYTTVTTGNDVTLNFITANSHYRTENFNIGSRTHIHFAPGDYWINGDLNLADDVVLHTTGAGPVRIFVAGAIGVQARLRTTNAGSENLLLFAKGNISMGNDVQVNGFLYSESGDVTLGARVTVNGGISAAGEIYLDNDSQLHFSAADVTNANFGALCGDVSAPAFSHWQVSAGASASTCHPHEVSISARDADNNLLADYGGGLNLSTSTNRGSWSKTNVAGDALGVLTPGPNNSGTASYTFAAEGADQGHVRLWLTNSQAQSLAVTATEPDTGSSAQSGVISFAENAFIIISTDAHANDLIAGRSHSLQAQMLRQDPSTGECGPAPEYQNDQVQVWLARSTADPGGAAPTLTSAGGSVTPPNGPPGSNNFTLPFSAGLADFSLHASDVGQYALNMRDSNLNFSDIPIDGGSATWVVRPFGFAIAVLNNPGATNADGPVFRPAGDNFAVQVTAVAWQAADDTNNDGRPDGHQDTDPDNRANLNDNPTLVSFGRETPGATVRLSAHLLLPAEGINAELANGDTSGADGRLLNQFNNGVAVTEQVYYPEVGIAQLSAQLDGADYLGVGALALRSTSTSGQVGRFTPGYFEVQPDQIQASCSQMLPFSYMAQPFTLNWRLLTRNSRGIITSNYDGDFNKIPLDQNAILMRAIDQTEPTPLSERISHQSQLTWTLGIAEVSSAATLARDLTPDGPFDQLDLGVRVTDTDGISLLNADLDLDTENDASMDAVALGETDVRFGRLRLADAFGPETANLPVTLHSEYWRDGYWNQNQDDDCTTLNLTAIAYNGESIDDSANRTVAIGASTSTGHYSDINGTRVRLQGGDAGHFFSAPGAGNTGALEVDINLNDYPWLTYDWSGDGNYAEPALPTATFTFGTYRGHDRVLYWREILE